MEADNILEENELLKFSKECGVSWDEVGIGAKNYGQALRELRLENRILENQLWRLTALYMKRLGSATQRRILLS